MEPPVPISSSRDFLQRPAARQTSAARIPVAVEAVACYDRVDSFRRTHSDVAGEPQNAHVSWGKEPSE